MYFECNQNIYCSSPTPHGECSQYVFFTGLHVQSPFQAGLSDPWWPIRPKQTNCRTWPTGKENSYGCFLKWWYPQIIHFNRVFHYKPSILGYPYFWKHPYSNSAFWIILVFNPGFDKQTPLFSTMSQCSIAALSRLPVASPWSDTSSTRSITHCTGCSRHQCY